MQKKSKMERPRAKASSLEQVEAFFKQGSASAAKGLDYDELDNFKTAQTFYAQALGYFAKGLQVHVEGSDQARGAALQAKMRENMRAVEERLRVMPAPAPTPKAEPMPMAVLEEPVSLLDRLTKLLIKPAPPPHLSTSDFVSLDGGRKQRSAEQPQTQTIPQSFFAPVGPSQKAEKKPENKAARDDSALLAGVDKETQRRILDVAVDSSPGVAWNDIAGLDDAKRALYEAVVLPSLRPDLFCGLRTPASGVLLFGPPGCGKTMLAKAVATEAKCAFFSISASSLMSKFLGESENLVKGLFSVARYVAPAVIFIDEIDSLLSERSDKEHEASRRVKTEFLVQWDGLLAVQSEKRILVMGATNRPQDLDEAAIRRMPQRVYIPLPDAATRRVALEKLLASTRHALTGAELDWAVGACEGYSQSDLRNLCQQAAMEPLRELGPGILTASSDGIRPVGRRDFEAALKYARPSVDQASLRLYEQFRQKFGMM
jgi:SpoVK/Ycf46/Vps4 family AAA+-type ATPase